MPERGNAGVSDQPCALCCVSSGIAEINAIVRGLQPSGGGSEERIYRSCPSTPAQCANSTHEGARTWQGVYVQPFLCVSVVLLMFF